jgi:hypothetical protein
MDGVAAGTTIDWDLASASVRDLNQFLHDLTARGSAKSPVVRVLIPNGQHSIAVGV